MSHLVIMAAGTGGHVIPGLAVAEEMQKRGWTVSWLGTTLGMENRLVPPSGIPMDTIAFSGMRGKGSMHSLTGGLRLLGALFSCLGILRRRGADAVLGMGGYVCLPGGLVASLIRRPLMLINADAALLLSNRALLPMAAKVGFGFDGKAAHATRRAVVTGNPVRAEIEAVEPPLTRFAGRRGPLKVLVVGGSLGARALNDCMPQALAAMPFEQRPLVTHQSGLGNHEQVIEAYARTGVEATIVPFIDNMSAQLAQCDVIVCRSGAITISELCAAGVASILVPLVVSTTSHQRENAEWLAGHDAAIHLPQRELSPRSLAAALSALDRDKLQAMAERARALSQRRSAARVADEIETLIDPMVRLPRHDRVDGTRGRNDKGAQA
jgi:UDP-N-acetylglucosamine--N-acetylmuramyl-(pentapeptide) pyrophosphoryl-undecaprenol N-acetylglucosamine transferase